LRPVFGEDYTIVDGDFSGAGLIDKLMELQSPKRDRFKEDRDKFLKINQFVQTVIGCPSAMLQIPHDKECILVDMEGKILPLVSLGTGVHELIIMAAAATVLQNQVLCIEEPEIHLHPLLQKQLLKYLKENTSNQYFISTHSAHILDTTDAAIFHVKLENGQSRVELAMNDTEKSKICDDLGYRASDLLQANCAIWVEGPSDRIYLNHWIHNKAPELIEGLHYSIMFYGGRLLSHLTADDTEVDEFISLRRLNRHITIVMDSDCSGPEKEINDTKKRIREEFDKGPGFAWVTQGREIENYINPETMENAVKKTYQRVKNLCNKGQYDNVFAEPVTNDDGESIKIDKVKIAREVVQTQASFEMFDLGEKMERLVNFMRESNGMNTASQME
jgi:predicted ATP-dependent endonuclease of OLD family